MSTEPIVGKKTHGNIVNKIMGKDFMYPDTHHTLVDWCMQVLGYESATDDSIPNVGYDDLDEKFIAELNERVQKIEAPLLLLKLYEVAKEGIRGRRGDKYNDAVATTIQNACLSRLRDFMDELPPSLWHKVHRHELWMGNAETEKVSLPSPNGWIAISGVREAQRGAWQVRIKINEQEYLSPQYVTGMGMKARHDGDAKGSHSGVQCQAFHLFNADGTFWGFEVYLISPKKTVGCEVTKDGVFSLFRSGAILPPRDSVRQGDMLLRRVEVQQGDEVELLTEDSSLLMRSVTITPSNFKLGLAKLKKKEHRHEGYDYWHPTSRIHAEGGSSEKEEARQTDEGLGEESILLLTSDSLLTHPDHPTVALEAGYYQILPVEGKTDYQPSQRGGD